MTPNVNTCIFWTIPNYIQSKKYCPNLHFLLVRNSNPKSLWQRITVLINLIFIETGKNTHTVRLHKHLPVNNWKINHTGNIHNEALLCLMSISPTTGAIWSDITRRDLFHIIFIAEPTFTFLFYFYFFGGRCDKIGFLSSLF